LATNTEGNWIPGVGVGYLAETTFSLTAELRETAILGRP
jgi:hypothetical protein